MPDITNELDDLLNTLAETDRPAMRDLLTRNPNAASVLVSQKTVYDAFVGGDPVKMAAAAASGTTTTTPTTPTTPATPPSASPQSIGLGLDQISALLNERIKSVYTSPNSRPPSRPSPRRRRRPNLKPSAPM